MDMRWGDAPDIRDSQDSLVRAFLDDISALGYAAFDAFCIDPDTILSPVQDGNWAVASYDLRIIREYMTDGVAAICPALTEAGRSLRPYDYVALLESQSDNASARWQRRLLRLFGVNHAWLVPMSSLRFIKGVTVYMTGRGERAAERFHATRDDVHLRAILLRGAGSHVTDHSRRHGALA